MKRIKRLNFPFLENELKKSRMLSSIAALEILGKENEIANFIDRSFFKNSCVSDADKLEPLTSEEYEKWNIKFGNGVTLVRARYSKQVSSEHYQLHNEIISIENGEAKFFINGINIDIKCGSKLGIPAKSHYTCEFLENTCVIVSIPTLVFKTFKL